ncbi:MAG: cupin [Alphaproteobacteria bacterium]|nr:cupin [Alphaproteobacteria bacterium]
MPRHPGFGLFDKEHREFFDALDDTGWQAVPGYSGVEQKLLSGAFDHEAKSGAVTRLSRWAAGAAVTKAVSHDWCEEVFLISGALSIGTPENEDRVLPAGTYAVRPADVPHGPFFSKDGCLMIEFLYYPPDA